MAEALISRRLFNKTLGHLAGGLVFGRLITGEIVIANEEPVEQPQADKPRVRLRPYHPTYVISYLGKGLKKKHKGFLTVIDKIKTHPDLEVEMVEGYDDICMECEQRAPDPEGSVWGKDSTCPSAQNPRVVADVYRSYMKMLKILDLDFGSVISMRELTARLEKLVPVLDDPMIGGPDHQTSYKAGLKILSVLYAGQ